MPPSGMEGCLQWQTEKTCRSIQMRALHSRKEGSQMRNVKDGFHLLELERKIWMHGLAFKQNVATKSSKDSTLPGDYRSR